MITHNSTNWLKVTIIAAFAFNFTLPFFGFAQSQEKLAKIALEHKKVEKRQKAVEKLYDQKQLYFVIIKATDENVYKFAIKKLYDLTLWAKVAEESKDPFIRKTAVDNISDQVVLFNIALNDKDKYVSLFAVDKLTELILIARIAIEAKEGYVCIAALQKLTDQTLITKVAMETADANVCNAALKKITEYSLLAKFSFEATNSWQLDIRVAVIDRINNQELLVNIAQIANHYKIREAATIKIIDQTILANIAISDESSWVRAAATEKLSEQYLLTKLILESKDIGVIKTAIEKLIDEAFLAKVATESKEVFVRLAAVNKLNDQELLEKISKEDIENKVCKAANDKLAELIAMDNAIFYLLVKEFFAAIDKGELEKVKILLETQPTLIDVKGPVDKEMTFKVVHSHRVDRTSEVITVEWGKKPLENIAFRVKEIVTYNTNGVAEGVATRGSINDSVALEMAKLLIANGAKINPQDGEDAALLGAMRGQNWALAKLLINNGAKLDVKMQSGEEEGKTPLDYAKTYKNVEMIELLTPKSSKTTKSTSPPQKNTKKT